MPSPRVAILFVLAIVGCRAKIGDACTRSTDCSLRGDRICDLSHRVDSAGIPTEGGKGECTIEGCGHDSCPDEAACVKVYGSDFLTVACDPLREDVAIWADPECVDPESCDALPPLDLCEAHEVCLPEGLCADELTARTSCRRKCGDDGDCRAGYECVRTGTRGMYRAADPERPGQLSEVDICVPEA